MLIVNHGGNNVLGCMYVLSGLGGEDVVNEVGLGGMKVVLLVVSGFELGCDGW